MNYQAIYMLNLFGIVLLALLFFSRFMTRQRRRLSDRFFTELVLLTMVASAVEIYSFWVDGRSGAVDRVLNLLSNTYLYMANVIGCFIWLMYVDLALYRDRKRLRRMLPVYGFGPAVCVTALIVNLFCPILFYVDEEGIYHRQPLCIVLYLSVAVISVSSLVIYYIFRAKNGRKHFFPIWMFMAPVLAGCLAQGFIYGISTAWPATAIGLCAIHMSIQNQKSFTDPLTGLYNRQFLEQTIAVFDESKDFFGIMFDLNHFKQINDNYGHSMGDRALVNVGHVLREAAGTKGSAFRFAGDEFIVLVSTDTESDVIAVEERVRELAEKFNASTSDPYKLSFSMGHVRHTRGESQDDFLRLMDVQMYSDKEKMHRLLDDENGAEGDLR